MWFTCQYTCAHEISDYFLVSTQVLRFAITEMCDITLIDVYTTSLQPQYIP